MPLNRRSAVIGCSIMAPTNSEGQALEELLYDVAQAALKDAGIKIDDIDGLVVASNDQFDGRAISIMAASGSVGGVDRDILSTPSGSEHALAMGILRIASGLYETHLIVSWSPVETRDLSEAERLGADPYFHRALPLDELSAFALQASALQAVAPEADALSARILKRNKANGAIAYPDAKGDGQKKMLRWPVSSDMVAPPSVGAVAMVIASEDYVAEHKLDKVAWINGMGWATEAGFLGDRDLASAGALEAAAQHAYEEAGISDPASAFDVVELTAGTPYQELLVYEGLKLSDRSAWSKDVGSDRFERSGALPVNPSGGVSVRNPVFCTGLVRIAEVANQVRGVAGAHQIDGVKTGLAHAASGFAMTYQAVTILSSHLEGAHA